LVANADGSHRSGESVVVIIGVFVLNYFVVMPRIGRSSRSHGGIDEPGR